MEMGKRSKFQVVPGKISKNPFLALELSLPSDQALVARSVGFTWGEKRLFCLFKLCMSYIGSIKYYV
jgi:hypothetical protein